MKSFRHQRLGRTLRRLREDAGMSATDVAKAAGLSLSTVTRAEGAEFNPSDKAVRAIGSACGAADDVIDALVSLAGQVRRNETGWLPLSGTQVPDALASILTAEADATEQCVYAEELIPGLVQTTDYATAVITAGSPNEHAETIKRRVALRIARQQRLVDGDIRVLAVIGEAALRRPVSGPVAMAEQLDYLTHAAEQYPLTVQVVPLASPELPAALGTPFELLRVDGLEFVYVEHLAGGAMLDESAEVERFRSAWQSLTALAMSPEQSLSMIREIAETHRG